MVATSPVDRARNVTLAVLRGVWRHFPGRPRFTFENDGLATIHYSPFLDDPTFEEAYGRVADRWTGTAVDIRWRAWILTRLAAQSVALGGQLAEFGTYRGACAALLLATVPLGDGQRLFLFDTFEGIPAGGLTPREQELGFSGRLADTSAESVARFLGPPDAYRIVPGDITETLGVTEVGPLCFAHLDLNAAAATVIAADYVYPRLVGGGVMLFDDYGWSGYEDQRRAVDDFFRDKRERPVALPTGQAFVAKLPD